jgi:hypothetical protein
MAMAVAMLAAAATGCSSGSTTSSGQAPAGCAGVTQPATPLLVRLQQPPAAVAAACLGRTYTDVVAPAWEALPGQVHAASADTHVWQSRVLQYGFDPCADCPRPGVDLAEVRRDHPDWILKDATGADIHPPGHPDWVMFDISNPLYLQAWADNVVKQLSNSRWAGVVLVDAGNEPAWTNSPIDPATGEDMTVADHAKYLAQAMALVRGGLKTNGLSMVAENEPFTIVDPAQIASTDAVSVELGFARLKAGAWVSLFNYFEAALNARVGAWVWDGDSLDQQQRVYGLASYLLVSGLGSAYGVSPRGARSLYDLDPGTPTALPVRQNGAYQREFQSGSVAVNPGPLAATVELSGHSPMELPPGTAVIDIGGHLTTSFSAAAGS